MEPRSPAVFVIPVFNQVEYTRQCLDSLLADGVPAAEVVVVDNASTDGTRELLASRPGLHVIANDRNLGCSAAWNQGVEAAATLRAEWVIVLNNDVVVGPGFRDGLLAFAAEAGCQVVSPAMGEGELDYDLASFAEVHRRALGSASRRGIATGVCFMVHHTVFARIGSFDTKLGLAGYEDEDFFRRASAAGFRLATTGRAYLHHYGSVTQKSVKAGMGAPRSARLGDRDHFRRKHGLHWLRRKVEKLRAAARRAYWIWSERRRGGLTLRLRRVGGAWRAGP